MFKKDIGIDLGTANTLVYAKGKGIILREPSVVAVDTKTDAVRYVGMEAKNIIGRTPGSIRAVRPLKDGVIADFDMTTAMLQEFIRKALGNPSQRPGSSSAYPRESPQSREEPSRKRPREQAPKRSQLSKNRWRRL